MRALLVLLLGLPGLALAQTVVPSLQAVEVEAAAVVQRQLEAYNRHDLAAFAATYADTVVLYQLPGNQVFLRGKAELNRVYGGLFQRNPKLRVELAGRLVSGPYVTDKELILNDSGGVQLVATAQYEVSGGKIVRVWFQPAVREAQ